MKSQNFICTIGPTNSSNERIQRMILKGMTVARLNLSHGSLDQHCDFISNIKEASRKVHDRIGYQPCVAVAVDLCGPEIRTGECEEYFLNVGDLVRLTNNDKFAMNPTQDVIFVDFVLAGKIKRNDKVFINDGEIKFEISEVFGDNIIAKVTKSGLLRSNQTVYVPAIASQEKSSPEISDKDKKNLEFAVEHDVDFIFASLVESGEWIEEIRQFLGEKGKEIEIHAKIQNMTGVENIEEIVKSSDGVIFAPTAAIDAKLIPKIQNLLLNCCKTAGKPCFMVFEEEMESMEVHQAVNWFLDGGDGEVFTNELSRGKFIPLETMTIFKNLIEITREKFFSENNFTCDDVLGSLASACVRSSVTTKASAIILIANSKEVIHFVHSQNPACEIVAVIENLKSARQVNILSSVNPVIYNQVNFATVFGPKIDFALDFAIEQGICKRGDTIIVLKEAECNIEVHYVPYTFSLKKIN